MEKITNERLAKFVEMYHIKRRPVDYLVNFLVVPKVLTYTMVWPHHGYH